MNKRVPKPFSLGRRGLTFDIDSGADAAGCSKCPSCCPIYSPSTTIARRIRAIYYWVTQDEQIYMLYVYPKNEQEDLTPEQKKALKTIVERWSNEK